MIASSEKCAAAGGKKWFAWFEMVFALICGVGIVLGWWQLNRKMGDLAETSSAAVKSYIITVDDGENIFRSTYPTIKQHRKALRDICERLKAVENVSFVMSLIPVPKEYKDLAPILKQFLNVLSTPLGGIRKSLEDFLKCLEELNEEKYENTLDSFQKTKDSLEAAKNSIGEIRRQFVVISTFIMLIMLFVCLMTAYRGAARLGFAQRLFPFLPAPGD